MNSRQLLSEFVIRQHFSRFLPQENRKEDWNDIIDRFLLMLTNRFPDFSNEISEVVNSFIRTKKVLPSMRALQFGGEAIEKINNRIFNCCYLPIKDSQSFSESMFLLLGGSGVGFSVQKHHIEEIPHINPSSEKEIFVVEDTIEGWALSIKALVDGYLGTRSIPEFDFSRIRPEGSELKTSGGIAPGPEPLKIAISKIEDTLKKFKPGDKLTSVACCDIMCYVSEAVFSGGIRRSAMIALFDLNDSEMMNFKSYENIMYNPQRWKVNISAVVDRKTITEEMFKSIWKITEKNGSGEPGIFLTNDKEMGVNPCGEASLLPYQFCNLTEINMTAVTSEEDFFKFCEAAAIIGTIQASFTDFNPNILRSEWKKNTEKDSLLGVSMTGILSRGVLSLPLEKGAQIVLKTNEEWAKKLGINVASRTTMVKPAGTTSCVLGTSSGIHPWYSSEGYIRRVTVKTNEPIYNVLKTYFSELIEHSNQNIVTRETYGSEVDTERVWMCFPIDVPEDAITQDIELIDFLNIVKHVFQHWVLPGHRDGKNTHNISCTVHVKEGEWESFVKWLWENIEYYNGITAYPYNSNVYQHLPFEKTTRERFEEMKGSLNNTNFPGFRNVYENTHNNMSKHSLACSSGSCELI